jgi:hypothetical protein
LPHLLLRPTQVDDVAGEAVRPAEDAATEVEELVDRRLDGFAIAEIIAEVDEAIALGKPLADQIVQAGEPARLAMHRGDRPNPAGTMQPREPCARGNGTPHRPRRGTWSPQASAFGRGSHAANRPDTGSRPPC